MLRKKISYWLIGFSFIFVTSCKSNTGQFILLNKSNEIITHGSIEVCKQVIEFKNIKPHGKFNGSYKITTDSHYNIAIFFASGKELRKEDGYVTNGFDFRDTITVTDTSVSVSDAKIK